MTYEDALKEMRACIANDDTEAAHSSADGTLCRFLRDAGFGELVDLWDQVDKWYA